MTEETLNRLLDELSEHAEHYKAQLERYRKAKEGSDEQADADGDLYAAIGQLEIHARVLREELDKELDEELEQHATPR
jgi:chaperonin cofactor prefoldin